MATTQQQQKAESLRALHHGADPLILANAWDVASARIVEQAGFPAIATSSAGVAFSLGYTDGQKIPPLEMFAAIARIARAVKVPVTADAEAGYGKNPGDAVLTVRRVIESGAVGMNFEDATGEPDHPLFELPLQVERIRAIRAAANSTGIAFVLNARTDTYLLQIGEPEKRYDETVRRLSAYRDAGADCVFVPGLRDAATIGRLVADVKCPVNILGGPGTPSVRELAKLGVKRISLGSGPMRAAMGMARTVAHEVKTTGTYTSLENAPPYDEMNKLLS
jgi:2-methylisocitrate lyase-like PEP mutase family enzyme